MAEIDDLVAAVLDGSSEADPSIIAAQVLAGLSVEQREKALALCLRDRVRLVIGRQRMIASQRGEPVDGAPGAAGESRWSRLREIDQRVNVDGTEKGWRVLGECTANDLTVLANRHEAEAEKQQALAERYRRYALLVRKSGKATLRDVFADADMAVAA